MIRRPPRSTQSRSSAASDVYKRQVIFSIVSAEPLADEVSVKDLKNFPQDTQIQLNAGYIQVPYSNEETLNFYYVMAQSQRNFKEDPVIFYFNGAEGCSSLFTFFYENGPFIILEDKSEIVENQYAWNKLATVVYVDLPNIGFSQKKEFTNAEIYYIASQVTDFVTLFFKKFPIIDDLGVYLAGSEMAGTFLTIAAEQIARTNQFSGEKNKISFEGLILNLSLIHISEPTRQAEISYAVFCLKKKK
eukprot:TRINITY_DN1401_c0_g1_i9.p1 TRINITY_DN1401_c0_g1~~TRINITY_DN1401_c0_g1_i9.p1  ORF type:complete len:246 (-),score=86.51 TRINITY_DN1401_c0_g1_i9:18-755(-)